MQSKSVKPSIGAGFCARSVDTPIEEDPGRHSPTGTGSSAPTQLSRHYHGHAVPVSPKQNLQKQKLSLTRLFHFTYRTAGNVCHVVHSTKTWFTHRPIAAKLSFNDDSALSLGGKLIN
jgi:hypothetical protein